MDTSSTLAADLVPVLIKEKMLSIAEKDLVFFELADKEELPEGQGKTIQFTRYERLPLPGAPATEGITPTETPLTTSTVQAVVDQWIAVVVLTDVAILTVRHPVLRVAQDRLATQHDETLDREVQVVLQGGSNTTFAGTGTSRSALTAGDVVTTDLVRKVVSNLRSAGARTYEGGKFVGVVDPFVEMDLSKDGTFVNAASYSNLRTLLNGEIGDWMGVRWKRSNLIPIITLMANVGNAGSNVQVLTAGAAATGSETAYATGSTALVQVTLLDPVTGFETTISGVQTLTIGAGNEPSVLIQAAAPTGTYNVYVSLENGAVATRQLQGFHTQGTAGLVVGGTLIGNTGNGLFFAKAGTPNGAGHFITTATGAVAPPAPPASALNVHVSYVFGREAFGVVDLAGLQTFLTPATATDSDPAVQRRKASWKQIFKAVIKNDAFYRRVESLSAFN